MATYGDINPLTGQLYTPDELMKVNSGLDPYTGLASPAEITPKGDYPAVASTKALDTTMGTETPPPGYIPGEHSVHPGETTPGCDADGNPCDAEGNPLLPTVTMPEVTPAPAYEISPAQQELQDQLMTTITDWVAAGGYGLAPDGLVVGAAFDTAVGLAVVVASPVDGSSPELTLINSSGV